MNKLRKELRPVFEIVGAVVVTIVLYICGVVWNLGKPFYDTKGRIFSVRFAIFWKYWIKILLQIWRSIQFLLHKTALWLDYTWNAVAGEFLEDIFTHKENTWFGNGTVTVSAAIGQLEYYGHLNKTGLWFSKFLDKAFNEHRHCYNAYMLEIADRELHKS